MSLKLHMQLHLHLASAQENIPDLFYNIYPYENQEQIRTLSILCSFEYLVALHLSFR